jgi:6-phosphofructo-2-kinase/fructose-2,6-biphosphatase 2
MPGRANGVGVQVEDTKICVVMVGLPARGKSYIAQIGKLELPVQVGLRDLNDL